MNNILNDYRLIRQTSEALCQPLKIEDYVIQSMEDVSPPKWHLAHTTWFFETFLLANSIPNYQPFNPLFHYLFNSYYHGVGPIYPRAQRGLLARPTVNSIYEYRKYVDNHVQNLWETILNKENAHEVLLLGLQHEQQHQELLLMDIKFNLWQDPNYPTYYSQINSSAYTVTPDEFVEVEGGLIEIGHKQDSFCFDNELPRHQQFIKPYKLGKRLITNGEYLAFIEAGGYQDARFWLADGWDCIQRNKWHAPLYWQKINNQWFVFTLQGLKEVQLHEPVAHVSFYEADAYAKWRNLRLPTELEWEHYVETRIQDSAESNFLEDKYYHPKSPAGNDPQQFYGDLWEWTSSAYSPYPGYKPFRGAFAEYNGKFMNNQWVLRGGSCVTPRAHIRSSYRNFFQPDKRWQFSGIRLAEDIP